MLQRTGLLQQRRESSDGGHTAPLFALVKKALAIASREDGVAWPRTSALTRWQVLCLSAAAAIAAALAPVFD